MSTNTGWIFGVAPLPTVAAAAGAAGNTLSNLGWIFGTTPFPTEATATATSHTPSGSVKPTAGGASAVVTADITNSSSAVPATATAAAQNATADISTNLGWIFGVVGFADSAFGAIGEAFGAAPGVSVDAAIAASAASAFTPSRGAQADAAAASAAALDVSADASNRTATAQPAEAGAVAMNAVGGVFAAHASATGTANNATISNTPVPVSAFVHAAVATASSRARKARALGASAEAKVRTSIAFIKSQMEASERPVTSSTITLSPTYNGLHAGTHSNTGWLFGSAGQVQGSFSLTGLLGLNTGWIFAPGATHRRATEQLCPITVTSPPGSIPPSYRGTVVGTVSGLGGSLLYKVQAYRLLDIDYDMHVFGNIDASGNFSLDLSTVPPTSGTWRFAVVLRSTSMGQVGEKWPQPRTYRGLVLQRYEITSSAALVETQPAPATNTFRFNVPALGRQRVRIIDTLDAGALVADYTQLTGCVRSYLPDSDQPGFGTVFAQQCYVEDQGAALAAMVAANERTTATSLADGLLLMQTSGGGNDGGFIYSAQHLSPEYGDAVYRTGPHATALYALLKYVVAVRDRSTYRAAATRGLAWLAAQLSGSGLYTQGSGAFSSEIASARRVNDQASNVVTADNFAVWHCLNLASRVFGEAYLAPRDALQVAIMDLLWQPSLRRFARGYNESDELDLADVLELHTLGAIWLRTVGEALLAEQTLGEDQLSSFYFILHKGGVV